jgi:hypothetical protein
LKNNIMLGLNDFLGKSILYILNDVIFEEKAFDVDVDGHYNSIVDKVRVRMEKSLPEFVKALAALELEKLINKMEHWWGCWQTAIAGSCPAIFGCRLGSLEYSHSSG